MLHHLKKAFLILLIAVPILYVIYAVLIEARPYAIFETDPEPDYFYNAWRLLNGEKIASAHHPGIPGMYLLAMIMSCFENVLTHTQSILNTSYVWIAGLSTAVLAAFTRITLKRYPFWVKASSLLILLSWPSAFTYLGLYSADSFMMIFGLPFLMMTWHILSTPHHINTKICAYAGLAASLALLNKITFLPLLVIASAILGLRLLHSPYTTAHKWRFIGVYIASFTASTLIVAWSILPNLIKSVLNLFHHKNASLSMEQGGAIVKLSALQYPTLLVVICLGTLLFMTLLFHRPSRSAAAKSAPYNTLLLGAGFLFFVYTFFLTYGHHAVMDLGIPFRNVMPFHLILPFCIMLSFDIFGDRLYRRHLHVVIGLLVVSLFINVLTQHIDSRHRLLQTARQLTHTVTAYTGHANIAFWDASGGSLLNHPATFHHWGNYTYGRSHFTETLNDAFPHMTLFNLRDVVRLLKPTPHPPSSLRDLFNTVRQHWGLPTTPPSPRPFSVDTTEHLDLLLLSERELNNEMQHSAITRDEIYEYIHALKPIQAIETIEVASTTFLVVVF